MSHRNRVLSGLFALLAMTTSLAEAAWASMCVPAMDMEHATAMPAGDDCMSAASGDNSCDGPAGSERPCPFGPAAAAQGCGAVPSLPAQALQAPSSSFANSGSAFSREVRREILLETSLFHPPRP